MKIKVWSDVHCAFDARHLVQQLKKLGHDAIIIESWNQYDECLHILYQVSNKYNLPKNYILVQTEAWFSHWFNAHYHQTIRKAMAVWDYSEANQHAYEHENKCIVTPGINPQPAEEKTIENLFYGWVEGSKRRQAKLKNLSELIEDLKIVTNLTGQEMWSILAKTKNVLNVHYYHNSPLELYRFHEALSFGCRVYLIDEQQIYKYSGDNIEEIKHGLKIAGI